MSGHASGSPAYENPMLSVDVVALRRTGSRLEVGVAPRRFEPHLGELALPGVLMAARETVLEAATRALRTKLLLEPEEVGFLGKGRVYDTPDRDMRGPTVSVGCIAIVSGSGRGETEWVTVGQMPHLPFDHDAIVAVTIDDVLRDLWRERDLLRALLGTTFTTVDAAAVVEQLSGSVPYGSTVRRQLANTPFLEELAATQPTGRGRPATTWGFTG